MWDIIVLFFNIWIAFVTSIIQLIWKPSEKSIHGEICLVTGAGHGIGRLMAQRLASLGATMIVVDVNEESNNETKELIAKSREKVFAYTADLRSAAEIKKLARKIREEVGDVTMLVNNAGVIFCTDILSLSDERLEATFDVNVLSHFRLIREFLPQMKKKNHGHIIGIASYGGFIGTPYMSDYCSSKHAVIGMMTSLRAELKRQGKGGVKVTAVCPTFVSTGFVKNPRSRYSTIPVIPPEEVIDRAVPAILRNEFVVAVPSFYLMMLLVAMMPQAVVDVFEKFSRPEIDLLENSNTD